MREIYLYQNNGQATITPVKPGSDVDAALLQAAQNDNFDELVPLFATGDPDLAYVTAFRHPAGVGGLLVAFADGDDPMFGVIAQTNLDLLSATSHFSNVVSEIRYGVDIFENLGDEES